MKFYTKPVKSLTEAEYKACKKATFSGTGRLGSMQPELIYQRKQPGCSARAYMCWENDKLLGWALGFNHTFTNKWTVYVYVRATHRRRGIGSKLLARARMGRRSPVRVCPWDSTATSFYQKAINSGKAEAW